MSVLGGVWGQGIECVSGKMIGRREALCHQFSNIYVVARNRDATIKDSLVG